jgi:enamine deaminase RidA (YjgF/YER057c/UK114 family)
MTESSTGIRSHAELLAAGWERRYVADLARAQEAVETYGALGFEVLAQPIAAEQVPASCGDCSATVCRSFMLIYTRPRVPEGAAIGSPEVEASTQGAARAARTLQPPGWRKPKGYSNGVMASGTWVCVAGQVGWDENEQFAAADLVGQARQALTNIVCVLAGAGAGPAEIVRLTWYVTDKRAYMDNQRELGVAYRDVMGSHYPAMSLVVVAGLVEEGAVVEIEATAVIPEAVS